MCGGKVNMFNKGDSVMYVCADKFSREKKLDCPVCQKSSLPLCASKRRPKQSNSASDTELMRSELRCRSTESRYN